MKIKVSDLRSLEKQVLQGEISYSRMVEILNEISQQQVSNTVRAESNRDASFYENLDGYMPNEKMVKEIVTDDVVKEKMFKALESVLEFEKRGADVGKPRIGNGILNIVHEAVYAYKQSLQK